MRLFLAINFPADCRREVLDAAAPLRAAAPGVSWMDDARIHLTLKFLGEVPEAAVPGIAATMDAVASRFDAIPSSLGEFGAFPNFRKARIVWIGMESDPRLELLHHDVEVACDTLGFPIEARPFRPHVTLGRVNARLTVDALRALEREARRAGRISFPVTVAGVDLMRSTLRVEGAVYERLHTSPLRET